MQKDSLKNKLTKTQFDVTQNCSTEKPFDNEYWDNKEPGIYVDIVSGDPLFCSIQNEGQCPGHASRKPILNML